MKRISKKKRMSRETLMQGIGDISEVYVQEAADLGEATDPSRDETPQESWWRRLGASPAFAIGLGLVVALVVVAAIIRTGWTSPETPVGTEGGMPGASLYGTEVSYTPPADAPEEDAELIAQGYTARVGRIVCFTNGYFFVWQDSADSWDFTVLQNGFGQTDAIPNDLEHGDLVRVYYQYIQETYPSSMPVYRTELLERGDMGQVDRTVLGEIMELHNRLGEGWELRFENNQTGRLYRMENEWFLLSEDDQGSLSGAYFILKNYEGLDLGLDENFQTGDRVKVSGGLFYYTDPPILPINRVTLLERGDEGNIDLAILEKINAEWKDLIIGGTLPPMPDPIEPETDPEHLDRLQRAEIGE